MSKALRNYGMTRTDVHNALLGQVRNNTGGFVYELTDVQRLERFLILGVDGGTYYVTESDLTKSNIDFLIKHIAKNWREVLDTVLDVSLSGRAVRNGPAIFVVALILNHGNDEAKKAASEAAPKIARNGTMIFELAQYIENLGGWGRAKRRAIANWFKSKTPDQLAYQAVKYRQRNGWTLRDLMRLSHPVGIDPMVGDFILRNDGPLGRYVVHDVEILNGFKLIQQAQNVNDVVSILGEYIHLPWETIPTQFLREPIVWKQLYINGQLKGQALVRNVKRLSQIGAFSDTSFRNSVAADLSDADLIVKSKVHPINYLNASIVYEEGSIDRGNSYFGIQRQKNWTTDPVIAKALNNGFYNSFKNITPSGKRFLVALDVSGSMSWSAAVGSDLTAMQAGAAMALILAKAEQDTIIRGFSTDFVDLHINPDMRFPEVMKKIADVRMGATNIAKPMEWASNTNSRFDAFVIITDNETNSGSHPSVALQRYRDRLNPEAKMIVMGTTSTGFSVADPRDPGSLDVVGFDSNVPKLVSDFAKGF